MTPSEAIRGLYAAFNARDAVCVASFLTDDCVYEDLLLGPATVCRGKEAFMNALRFHPAFVSSRLFDGLPFASLLPDLTLEVDSIAEGVDTVGVEWHVQCGAYAFPLGRGLSQASICCFVHGHVHLQYTIIAWALAQGVLLVRPRLRR